MKSWLPSSAPSSYYESALSSWPYPRLAKRFQANLYADQTDQTTSKRLGSMIPMARIGKRFDQTNDFEDENTLEYEFLPMERVGRNGVGSGMIPMARIGKRSSDKTYHIPMPRIG